MRRCLPLGLCLAAVFAAVSSIAGAQAWPSKVVRVIVPGGPGGVIDLRARWLAERLTQNLGQPFVVEPQPGAAGRIGTEAAIRSAPDGHTLLITHQGSVAVQPHLFRLAYDPVGGLEHITPLSWGTLVVAVNPSVPAKSLGDLISLAKAQPGKLPFGSPGIGTPPHLAAELLKHLGRFDALHVPYKGGGQAANDLVGGHVAWSVESLTVLMPYVRAGRIRPLAVTSSRRLDALPDVPTVAEAGVPGYEYVGWVGLAAPAGTPAALIHRIYQPVRAILASAEAREYFRAMGGEPGGEPPETFSAFVRAEYEKWGRVVRDAGIKAE